MDVVLEGGAGQQKSDLRLELTNILGKHALIIFDPMSLINDKSMPFDFFQGPKQLGLITHGGPVGI